MFNWSAKLRAMHMTRVEAWLAKMKRSAPRGLDGRDRFGGSEFMLRRLASTSRVVGVVLTVA